MNRTRGLFSLGMVFVFVVLPSGCAAPNVDLSSFQRPERPTELDAFDVFVGSWTWKAVTVTADRDGPKWSGMAEWTWALDKRVLEGRMEARSGDTEFKASGAWSWHPRRKEYIWWMFNNWGYPQEGTASYDRNSQTWTMKYQSVGLDGTTSYGRYTMKVIGRDTLDWSVTEWADPLHLVRKMEMSGTYTRKK